METQGTDDMAIIQKFEGEWKHVSDINAPHVGNIIGVVWSFAELERGVPYRAIEVRKRRGQDAVNIKELTPVLVAATIDVSYENEYGEHPIQRLTPNIR